MVIDRFFIWVAEATTEQKIRAVDALVAAYFDERIDEDDREAIEAAMTLVADDADLAVRRRLAEVLAAEDGAPRHILHGLLRDHPAVAVPIAARSQALIDAELVDLVAEAGSEVHGAVAGRRRVGPTVATALMEVAERPACIALLANPGADLPALALERAVERFGEFSDLRQVLLARPHVPITVRHRVLEKLAEAIENLVVVKAWMRPDHAGTSTRDAKDKATVALASGAGAAEMAVLVEHLRRTGQLTTRLMLRAACVGNLRFVEEALACLAGMPSNRVAALVADGRDTALRALYRRSAMPERAYPAFQAAIEVHRELVAETGGLDGRPGDQARFSRRLVERVLTRFTAFERADADDLLVLLRRFAADAARDRVRAVMAERMADAGRALAAPRPEPSLTEGADPVCDLVDLHADPDLVPLDADEAVAAVRSPVTAAVLDAVAAELGVALDAEWTAEVVDGAAESIATTGPSPELEEEDLGLFGHLRLEDLPPEWRFDEVPAEDLFGDDDVPFRRALVPELRLVDDGEPMMLRGEADAAPMTVVEDAPVDEVVADAVEAVAEDAVADEVAEDATASHDAIDVVEIEADAAPEPEREPEPVDPFISELEDALEALLGPAPRRARPAIHELRGAA